MHGQARFLFDSEQRMTAGGRRNTLSSRPARARRTGRSVSIDRDYEIRFLKGDGTTSLVFVTSCASDEHARETAQRMMMKEFARFEIWRGQQRVA